MTRLWIGLALFACTLLIALALPERQLKAQMLAFHSHPKATGHGPRARVTADLARRIESWRGARACASSNRARLALKPVFAHWLGTQMMARPDRKVAVWGYHSGDVWTEDRIVDGRPACSAGFRKLIVYADFR